MVECSIIQLYHQLKRNNIQPDPAEFFFGGGRVWQETFEPFMKINQPSVLFQESSFEHLDIGHFCCFSNSLFPIKSLILVASTIFHSCFRCQEPVICIKIMKNKIWFVVLMTRPHKGDNKNCQLQVILWLTVNVLTSKGS